MYIAFGFIVPLYPAHSELISLNLLCYHALRRFVCSEYFTVVPVVQPPLELRRCIYLEYLNY